MACFMEEILLPNVLVFARNIFLLVDICLNATIGGLLAMLVKTHVPALGNPHYSCSEAWAEMRDLHLNGQPIWMYKQGCVMCRVLTWVQNAILRIEGDHCSESMQGVPSDIEAG